MPKALSAETIEAIKRLAGEGRSLSSIARELGVSPGSVHKYAPEGSFERSRTAAAVKAHQVDAAARRAQLSERLLDTLEQITSRMGSPYTTHGWFGKDAVERQREHPLPPALELRALAGAFSSLAATHIRLEQFRVGDEHQDARDAIISFGNTIREMVRDELADPE